MRINTNQLVAGALLVFISPVAAAEPDCGGGVAIQLRIVDGITQVPVSGALVGLRIPDAGVQNLGSATNGTFNFSHAPTNGPVQLQVRADQYTTRGVSLSLTNSRVAVEVNLDRTAPFRGIVIAPTGQYASRAHVALLTKPLRFAFVDLEGKSESFNQTRTDDTDEDGHFSIGPDEQAEFILITHKLGIAEVPIIGWTNETKVQLRAWTAAAGNMTINGAPAANQSIAALSVRLSPAFPPINLQRIETQTDALGSFRFFRLPPGEVQVYWKIAVGQQSFSYSHNRSFIVDPALSRPLVYDLRGRSIKGRFTDAAGDFDWNADLLFGSISAQAQPVTEFSPISVGAFGASYALPTDKNGNFEATAVPPGKYNVHIHSQKRDDPPQFIEGSLVVPEGTDAVDLGEIKLKKPNS